MATVVAALALGVAQAADAPAANAAPTPQLTVIHCPHLIDTAAGKMLGATSIVVDGDRIREVVPGRADRGGAKLVELPADHTCLPGLIDSHTHLTSQFSKSSYGDQFRLNPADYAIQGTVYARRTLMAGFTTVRNLGEGDNSSIALRNAIEKGQIAGPRIFTAGKFIGTTGGHADGTDGYRWNLQGDPGPKDGIVNSPADAWKAVRQHYKDGADLIKIMPSGGVLDESSSSENPQMTLEETTHAAALLKHPQDFGSIAAGQYADVVAVPGDPIEDIALMKRVDFVMKEGVVYERDGEPANAALSSSLGQ